MYQVLDSNQPVLKPGLLSLICALRCDNREP